MNDTQILYSLLKSTIFLNWFLKIVTMKIWERNISFLHHRELNMIDIYIRELLHVSLKA